MTGEGPVLYRVVKEELFEEKTSEQILNEVTTKPCRYLKKEHSRRGNKCHDHEVRIYLG
jgi:hypothetical protein